MTRPPQIEKDRAQEAGQDKRILQLKLAGFTERQVSEQVGIPKSTVHDRLTHVIREMVQPPAEEYVAEREAELQDLYQRSYHDLVTADDAADRARALAACVRINESRRRLRGADAGESLSVTVERRSDLEAAAVTEAILAALDGLRLEGSRRNYALELAQHALATIGEEHPIPPPPPPDDLPPEPYVDPAKRFVIVDGVQYERPRDQLPRALPPGSSQRPAETGTPLGGSPVPPDGQPRADGRSQAKVDAILAEAWKVLEETEDDDED